MITSGRSKKLSTFKKSTSSLKSDYIIAVVHALNEAHSIENVIKQALGVRIRNNSYR